MTKSFFASLEAAGQLIEEEMDAVFRGSVEDTAELMTRRQASIKDTGTFQEGRVPVDEGELIGSQVTRIDGGESGTGEIAYEAFAGLTVDQVAEHVFTAPHARSQEYGFRIRDDNDPDDDQYSGGDVDVPGRFFVRDAVQQWDVIVDANVAHIKK